MNVRATPDDLGLSLQNTITTASTATYYFSDSDCGGNYNDRCISEMRSPPPLATVSVVVVGYIIYLVNMLLLVYMWENNIEACSLQCRPS
mmetsp:Transcript_29345/g.40905  ORF Transcript_29345/g.40905 Transcript_29345/m.40905 type:complete len:90 (-) Transcript_29345:29-298(-)